MNILIIIIISSFAVGFSTELIGAVVDNLLYRDSRIVKQLLAAPFGALYAWLLGVTGWTILIAALASGFLALVIMFWVNRPVQIQQVMSRRMQ